MISKHVPCGSSVLASLLSASWWPLLQAIPHVSQLDAGLSADVWQCGGSEVHVGRSVSIAE